MIVRQPSSVVRFKTLRFETPWVSFELRQCTGSDVAKHGRGKLRHYLTKILLATVVTIDDRPVRWPISWWVSQEMHVREAMLAACAAINRNAIAF